MHQRINKNRILFYIITFIFLTTIINQKALLLLKENFLLKKIIINIDSQEIKKNIILSTNYLINQDILFINKNKILNILSNYNYLENINIQKKFPSTIIINANKAELIAVTYIDQKKYFIGRNREFISNDIINNKKKLPIIFGKFPISEYFILKKIISEHNINDENIFKFYYHKNKRWDLYFDNGVIIKLPSKNVDQALNYFNQFVITNKISPNTVIDLRIPKRLILQNG